MVKVSTLRNRPATNWLWFCVRLVVAALPLKRALDTLLPGWFLYPSVREADRLCASWSRQTWHVAPTPSGIDVRLQTRQLNEGLPFDIAPTTLGEFDRSERRVLATEEGWLVGYDAGEFGGSLWWFSPDGALRERLWQENVRALLSAGRRNLAFVGLSHGRVDEGRVLEATKEGHSWRARPFAGLPGEPAAAVAQADDSVLVLTTQGLVRVDGPHQVVRLTSDGFGGLYPTSMVQMPNGVLYIGMRHFVVRLTPIGAGYAEDWFVPGDCPRFTRSGDECVCQPESGRP